MVGSAHLTGPAEHDIEILAGGQRWSGRLTVYPPRLVGWVSSGPSQDRLHVVGRFHRNRSLLDRLNRVIDVLSIQAWLKFEDVIVTMTSNEYDQGSAAIDHGHRVTAKISAPGLRAYMTSVVRQAQDELDRWDQRCQRRENAGPEAEARRARALWERADRQLIVGLDDDAARCDARDAAALLRQSGYSPDADTVAAGNRLAERLADLAYTTEADVVRAALDR